MASCIHKGNGCSPPGTPLYKCEGYYEFSSACENYVCENHVHLSRYGKFCKQCDPAPPVFDMPREVREMAFMAGAATKPMHRHSPPR